MKVAVLFFVSISLMACATLTEDAMTPVALSFSDGTSGSCQLSNKRGAWKADIPTTVSIRKSDDALKYQCKTGDGREAVGSIPSEMGAKIVASAVFIDLGITDAITDKHRKYAPSFVIPVEAFEGAKSADSDIYDDLEKLNELRKKGVLSESEFESEKQKLLSRE